MYVRVHAHVHVCSFGDFPVRPFPVSAVPCEPLSFNNTDPATVDGVYGDHVLVSCIPGHYFSHLTATQLTATCRSNQTWNVTSLQCERQSLFLSQHYVYFLEIIV